jgi:hypothetical protein
MRDLAVKHGYTPHIRTRGEEIELKARTPGWKARRWVVEACHSWMNRNRGILIRWSKKEENHLALLQLASGLIAFKKAHLATLTTTQLGQALNAERVRRLLGRLRNYRTSRRWNRKRWMKPAPYPAVVLVCGLETICRFA